MSRISRLFQTLGSLAAIAGLLGAAPPVATDGNVTRATLENGLEVVIVRDPLAPVVSIVDAYRAGADEAPADLPGLAHAQAHMAFRGCDGISGDQTAAIYAGLASAGSADAQQDVTQFETTVAAGDLDVALRIDSACMRHVDDAEADWQSERSALERETARDLSSPTYLAFTRINADLFAGTPYERDPLGTHESFEKMTGSALARFAQTWYAPNNAVLVIAGAVDPAAALASVRASYGSIPSHPVPARAAVNLALPNSETFTIDSDLTYAVVDQGYRFPGSDDPDYAAGRVLADVLGNPRNAIAAFAARGGALQSGFQFVANYPKASEAQAFAVVASGGDPKAVQKSLATLVSAGATSGASAELVDEAKRSEIAASEGARTSVPDLASAWSLAVAEEGRTSPDDDLDAIRAVTVADVDRVARRVLDPARAVTAILAPHPGAVVVSGTGYGGLEFLTPAPPAPVSLPAWAQTALARVDVPDTTLAPSDVTLPNGLRLIVQTESASDTVTVLGSIEHNDDVQVARGKDGVGNLLADLFPYGTQTLDKAEFAKALADAGATVSAGSDFSLRVAKSNFDRGVALLADDELHPALPAAEFRGVRRADAFALATVQQGSAYLAQRALRRELLPANDPALREATSSSIATVSLEDLSAYRSAVFRPDATTIVVIGNVTPAEARTAIEASFGRWTAAGAKPNVDLPPVPPNRLGTAVIVPERSRARDAAVLAETVAIRRADPAYAALQLGNRVLEKNYGLPGELAGALDAGKTRATYALSFESDPQSLAQTRRTIERSIATMQRANVSSSDLQNAKGFLVRRSALAQSNEAAVARDFITFAQAGLPLDETHRTAERYAGLDAIAVRSAFATYLRPNAFVLVVRGPAPR